MESKWEDQEQILKIKVNDSREIQGSCSRKLHLLYHGLTGDTSKHFTTVVVLKYYCKLLKVTTLVTFRISILWARTPLLGSFLLGAKKRHTKLIQLSPFLKK